MRGPKHSLKFTKMAFHVALNVSQVFEQNNFEPLVPQVAHNTKQCYYIDIIRNDLKYHTIVINLNTKWFQAMLRRYI